jgi:H+/Cl- antiporter ClcA
MSRIELWCILVLGIILACAAWALIEEWYLRRRE